MARVFVSPASDAGHRVFLDIDRNDGIRGGEDWEQRLYTELRGADAMVCVVSASYLASQWGAIEIAVAKSLAFVTG